MSIVLIGAARNSTSLKIYEKNDDQSQFGLLQGIMRNGAVARDYREG
jgi:hypothetical protein